MASSTTAGQAKKAIGKVKDSRSSARNRMLDATGLGSLQERTGLSGSPAMHASVMSGQYSTPNKTAPPPGVAPRRAQVGGLGNRFRGSTAPVTPGTKPVVSPRRASPPRRSLAQMRQNVEARQQEAAIRLSQL